MKEYVIVSCYCAQKTYWQEGYFSPDIKKAKKYAVGELPETVSKHSLYKIGSNPPLSWKYVSTCGGTYYIEELRDG